MKGQNYMEINEGTLVEALETYLSEHFHSSVKVSKFELVSDRLGPKDYRFFFTTDVAT